MLHGFVRRIEPISFLKKKSSILGKIAKIQLYVFGLHLKEIVTTFLSFAKYFWRRLF
jgi:hypothetical protein